MSFGNGPEVSAPPGKYRFTSYNEQCQLHGCWQSQQKASIELTVEKSTRKVLQGPKLEEVEGLKVNAKCTA